MANMARKPGKQREVFNKVPCKPRLTCNGQGIRPSQLREIGRLALVGRQAEVALSGER